MGYIYQLSQLYSLRYTLHVMALGTNNETRSHGQLGEIGGKMADRISF